MDRLAAVFAGVEHQPVAGLGDPLLFRDRRAGQHEVAQEGGIRRFQLSHRVHVPPWNHQHMDRRLGVDIFERHGSIILMHNF